MSTFHSYDIERKYGTDRARGILVGLALSAVFWVPVGVAVFIIFSPK